MAANSHEPRTAYQAAGVDTDEADIGLNRLVKRITRSWPPPEAFGGVRLKIGYFANVINIGEGKGIAICTDGVGTKTIIAQMMQKYDTIGIDCIAMNVNDLICIGADPLSFVDYIAIERGKSDIIDAIGEGLARGAEEAGVSISGGEISQLEDIVHGFDLAGTAIGTVPLDRIITGQNLEPGDRIVGIESSGIHSNGLTLARKAFFKRDPPLSLEYEIPGTGVTLGQELLRPTFIYVREIMEILRTISDVKALTNITGDGLLNLNRVDNARVGFSISELPPTPKIFTMIQQYEHIRTSEMFEVYNMGVGFCVIVDETKIGMVLSILNRHGRNAWEIGRVIEGQNKPVYIDATQPRLVGYGKRFYEQ
jgi:phosphoribosylformylglycinamidine cyclo-ligase